MTYATLCKNNAPFLAFQKMPDSKKYYVGQGNCNDWTCPRCGPLRAKREYGRMVTGCEELERDHALYFLTITTRGGGLSAANAKKGYLKWTNRLLSAIRANGKKRGVYWCYVQVTEWQKRGHPHSHFITTYYPDDLTDGHQMKFKAGQWQSVAALRSEYLKKRIVSAGLGHIYDISLVDSASAASRYVAKYLFKPTMFADEYPKNWRRIRYSRSFPKLPEVATDNDAFPLLTEDDYKKLARVATVVAPLDEHTGATVAIRLRGSDCLLDLSGIT